MSKVKRLPEIVIKKEISKIRAEFNEAFDRCFLCGTKARNTWPPRLETHELARGPDREVAKDQRCCLIRTCQRCHSERLDGMSIERQLAIKKLFDPEGYDRTQVNVIRSRHNLRGPQPDAITECDVLEEVAALEAMIEETGSDYPYPKWTW